MPVSLQRKDKKTLPPSLSPSPGDGKISAGLSLANNDADENPYNFTLEGTVAESSGYLPVIFKNP